MASFFFLVFSNPTQGMDAEYNRWYTEQHLDDVLKVPGIVAARRFALADEPATTPHRYLAIYEFETDDSSKVITELTSRVGTAVMPLSEAFDIGQTSMQMFKALTPRLVAKD